MKANTCVILLTLSVLATGVGTSLDFSKAVGISKPSLPSEEDSGTGLVIPEGAFGGLQVRHPGTVVPGDAGGEETFFPGDVGGEGIIFPEETSEDGVPDIEPHTYNPYLVPSGSQETVRLGSIIASSTSRRTTIDKYLWIEKDNKLLLYASIPQDSSLSLIAYTPIGGQGDILEMFPSDSNQGIYQKTPYEFDPGNNQIPYKSDMVGRHYLMFNLNDQSSNGIIIDVDNAMAGDSEVISETMPSEGA